MRCVRELWLVCVFVASDFESGALQHQFKLARVLRITLKTVAEMKRPLYRNVKFPRGLSSVFRHSHFELQFRNRRRFIVGELYLFHPANSSCPGDGSLWGVFDHEAPGVVYLESSTSDLRTFTVWCRLPSEYRYCRLATRSELRDYFSALIWYESGATMCPYFSRQAGIGECRSSQENSLRP